MKRWLTFVPLALLVGLILVGGALLLRRGAPPHFTEGTMGRPAPAFALQRLGGGDPVTAAAMAGRPYIVNVFASWCAPCRAEHPQLLALKARGVAMIGVAYKDVDTDTQHYLDQLTNPFDAVAVDPDGIFAVELGITGVPETYVIDAAGRVRSVYRGPLTEDVVTQVVLPAYQAAAQPAN